MALIPLGTGSSHLVELLDDADRLAARCAAASAAARRTLGDERRDQSALASLRLDGSPLTAVPDPARIADARATVTIAAQDAPTRHGTWFDAMRTFDAPDPDDPEAAAHDASVHALEFDGVARALASDELGPALLTDPLGALADLHEQLTRHLVAPDRAGRLRHSDQAVHDASVGRIMYFTVDPDRIADDLATLAAWLTGEGGREHGLVLAGVAHLELLRIHPFDAANGRLARTAARLLLRARGLDPDGLAAAEPALDADRLGYHDEVARTLRRRDATLWLERWAEAVTAGLRTSARQLGQLIEVAPSPAAAAIAAFAPGEQVTVADLGEHGATDPGGVREAVRALLDSGRLARVPGSRGLRFTVGAGWDPRRGRSHQNR